MSPETSCGKGSVREEPGWVIRTPNSGVRLTRFARR
jgi:hypothetical protein